jgi:hypothetical protein
MICFKRFLSVLISLLLLVNALPIGLQDFTINNVYLESTLKDAMPVSNAGFSDVLKKASSIGQGFFNAGASIVGAPQINSVPNTPTPTPRPTSTPIRTPIPGYIPTPTPTPYDDFGNGMSDAINIYVGSETRGNIDYFGDVDCFRFTAQNSASYMFYTTGTTDVLGQLLSNNGSEITSGDDIDGTNKNFKIIYALTQGEVYYISIRKFGSSGECKSFCVSDFRHSF